MSNSYQQDFLKGKSILANIHKLIKIIHEEKRNKKNKSGLIFLDFNKAFDSVDRTKLFKELWKKFPLLPANGS